MEVDGGEPQCVLRARIGSGVVGDRRWVTPRKRPAPRRSTGDNDRKNEATPVLGDLRAAIGNRATSRLLDGDGGPTNHDLDVVMPAARPVVPIQRQLAVEGSLSPASGGTITFALPKASRRLSYITVTNPKVAVNVKPTTATSFETRTEGTEGKAEISGAKSSLKHTTKKPGADKGESKAGPASSKLKGAIKTTFGNAAFADAEGAVGTDGGSIALKVGGAWQNATVDVNFTLISMGDEGKDIKITTATPSVQVRDIVTVEGYNFACTATLSVDVKPNNLAIARWLIRKGIIKSMRSVGGRLAQKIGAVPVLFVEGGYRTLEAAYKNVKVSKEIGPFIDAANENAMEAGRGFVWGALGGRGKLGAESGRQWFYKAYEVAKVDHPEMTEKEFRQALLASKHWQEQAQANIAYQVKGAIYRGFVTKKADEWSVPHRKAIREGLFKSTGPAPTGEEGLGVQVPEIVKLKPSTDIEFLDPLEVKVEKVPPPVRAEVRHRVKNYTLEQSFMYRGTEYHFEFDRVNRTIFVSGGGAAETIPFTPPWL